LLIFLPLRSGRNPPRCSRYNVYDDDDDDPFESALAVDVAALPWDRC
jgi:hypothetical protein